MADRRIRKRVRNILTIVISCVIVGYYVIGISLNQFTPKTSLGKQHTLSTPETSSTGLIVYQYDKTGELSYTMTANRADFFTASSSESKVTIPKVISDKPAPTAGISPQPPAVEKKSLDQLLIEDFAMDDEDLEQELLRYQDDRAQWYGGRREYLRIFKPVITTLKKGQAVTVLNASMAYLTDDGDTAELIGDVQVNDLAAATQLTTRALTLNTALQQILTQNPVTIHTATSTTHAVGLQGNLTDQRWHLLSEVRSVIQP